MARIEGQLGVSLRTGAGFGRDVGAVRATARAGAAARRASDATAAATSRIALGMTQRFNERHVHSAEMAYRQFKTDLLYGQDGLTLRQGADAEGMTAEAVERLNGYMQEIEADHPNMVVRDAVRQRLERDIAQTTQFMSRHEQARMEALRVSNSSGLYEQRRMQAVQQESERLLPNTELFAEEVEERTRLVGSMNPEKDIEEVTVIAQQQMADDAVKAVFRMMDESPTNVTQAQQLQEAYGFDWDPWQRSAVEKKIEDAVGFGLMQGSISAAHSANPKHSRKELVEGAQEQFEQRYEKMFGKPPSDKLVSEVRREAEAWDRLLDLELQEKKDKTHDALFTGFIQQTLEGTPEDVEQAFQAITKEGIATNDSELLMAGNKLYANYRANQTIFANELTPEGMELWLLEEGVVLPQNKVLAAAAEMPEAQWRSWAPKHQKGARSKMLTEDGALKVSGDGKLKAAIQRYRTSIAGHTAYGAKDQEFGAKLASLTALDETFVLQNGRKPSPGELDELVQAMEFDFDDGWDGAFDGTIGEFLLDPTGKTLDPTQRSDRFILENALTIARNDPEVARAVNEAMGSSIAYDFAGVEDIAKNPELVAQLLEFGLVSRTPIVRDARLGPLTGAGNIARAAELERNQ